MEGESRGRKSLGKLTLDLVSHGLATSCIRRLAMQATMDSPCDAAWDSLGIGKYLLNVFFSLPSHLIIKRQSRM